MGESPSRYRVGVDVGGTFVDFALCDCDGEIAVHKVPAEPADLAGSIMRGIADLAMQRGTDVRTFLGGMDLVVHGTTVATNAVLTGTGSRTGLLTTKGTRDALEMRRGVKEEPLDNKYEPPAPLVPRYLRLPVDERVDWSGNVMTALDAGSLEAAVEALKTHEVEAVAVCLMHAYANDAHERRVAERLREALPDVYLTVSSELLPQLGYYNRVSTAVLNSYVGPLLKSYLLSLATRLADAGFAGQLLIMNSAAGLMAPEEIVPRAAAALLSGPAAAPVAARVYAGAEGASHCAVIDMGGTSLDISLASGGEPLEVTEGRVGRYATALPMIDIRTLGAGGGSIAWIDAGGGLQVGPQSARAAPGPACYGKGGELPTCTDVDLLLGYLDPGYFLGGRMPLLREPAERAVREHLAEPLGISVEDAAVAAFEVINAGMASGIRDMIVDHGLDPEAMPMVVGGGAGPVHGAAVAVELGMREVIVPRQSGVFCAVGMLFAELKHDSVRSYRACVEQLDPERWRGLFTAMADEGRRTLVSEGGASRGRGGTLLSGSPLPAPDPRAQHADGRELGELSGNGHVARPLRCPPRAALRLRASRRSVGGGQPARPVLGPRGSAGPSARPDGRDGDAVARRCAAGLQPRGDVFPRLRRVPRRDPGRRLPLPGTGHRRAAADHPCGALDVRPAPR